VSVIDRLEGVGVSLTDDRTGARPATWSSLRFRYQAGAIATDLTISGAVFSALGLYVEAGTWIVALVGALAYVGSVAAAGGYDLRRAATGLREYRAIVRAAVVTLSAAMTLTFVGAAELPAVPVMLAVAGTAMTSALLRTAQRKLLSAVRADGALRTRAMLVAPAEQAARIAQELDETHPDLDLVGACVSGRDIGSQIISGLEVWGSAVDAPTVVRDADIDLVLVSPGAMEQQEFRQFRWALEETGTQLMIVPDVNEVLSGRLDVHVLGAMPMLGVKLQPSRGQRMAKAVMDRALGASLLLIASPAILLGMLAVRLDSAGPAIFRQVRIGRDGRPFTMFKLRTMSVDAEQRRDSLLEASTGAGPLFKMEADPRITSVGRVLRRFSLDELPQLWNVVRGDMSLVGPRPPLASEVATYDSMAVHRLHVKPGLTGLWQVSGRSDLSWEQSVRLDLRYVDNWSIGFDLLILWRTAAAVLGARGAY
jgi:exopolysaccharide biosynthesis polyprenyl glycosylphosphotransferase